MNIIFMGTPDFAVPCLEKLTQNHNVLAVYSQPDKPVGRKQILTPPPVKQCALENGIPVFQPPGLKNDEAVDQIRAFNADLIVVVAYGKILPSAVLNCAKYGCINVHASLLPKYRGAAPIQWAILNGDKQTGVTIMQMDEGLDTGDMLLVKKTDIDANETSEELFNRLSYMGADALIEAIDLISKGEISPQKQPDVEYPYAQKITKAFSPIDWSRSALEIHNQVRGLQTWPCAETVINGKKVKLHKSLLSDKRGNKPGEVVDNKGVLTVCCGDGACIVVTELQAEGKKRMDAKAYLQGNNIEIGTILGN